MDKDLQSIQEARNLVVAAREAQLAFLKFTQAQVDRVCEAMAEAAFQASGRLGQMAHEETGFGKPEHKRLKNEFAAKQVWNSIRAMKTVGVVNHDPVRRTYEIGWPMGVVAALIPSTNPTSTTIFKILISVKTRNGIVVAPHPSAAKCCQETARLMIEAAERAGMPPGLVSCMTKISLEGTQALMHHKYTAVILATGGSDMVKAAHSVGKPAYGVGPGNVPVYVDRSANIKKAALYIVSSKAFDCSVICATEQAVIADRPIATQLKAEMQALGAYFVNPQQAKALAEVLFFPNGAINAKSVGKTPQQLAQMANITIPASAKILVAPLEKVGPEEPLSREKLTTVLGWYEADGWEAGCDRCIEHIMFGGRGHSVFLHTEDHNVAMQFGLEKPVFRIGVNTMATLGAIGLTTGVDPSLTLGSGGIGGSISGDNITARHLLNIKRLAYEIEAPPPAALVGEVPATSGFASGLAGLSLPQNSSYSPQDIEKVVRQVIIEIQNLNL